MSASHTRIGKILDNNTQPGAGEQTTVSKLNLNATQCMVTQPGRHTDVEVAVTPGGPAILTNPSGYAKPKIELSDDLLPGYKALDITEIFRTLQKETLYCFVISSAKAAEEKVDKKDEIGILVQRLGTNPALTQPIRECYFTSDPTVANSILIHAMGGKGYYHPVHRMMLSQLNSKFYGGKFSSVSHLLLWSKGKFQLRYPEDKVIAWQIWEVSLESKEQVNFTKHIYSSNATEYVKTPAEMNKLPILPANRCTIQDAKEFYKNKAASTTKEDESEISKLASSTLRS